MTQELNKKRITQKDFKILLTFLNDSNPETLRIVHDQLKGALRKYPQYKKVVQKGVSPQLKNDAELFFESIRFEDLEPEFRSLFSKGNNLDLEKGLTLLAKIEYPNLKFETISTKLDQMAEDVKKLVAKEKPLPTKAVYSMRKYLFEKKKYHGDQQNYLNPNNLFINKVLETRKGMPITLSCIYLFIAWRLGFPVHGVGLPGHFVVGHRIPRGVMYIDPFHAGRVMRIKDCEVMVRRMGMQFRQEYLDPMPNLQIISRLIVNLINTYNDMGNSHRAHLLAQLFQLI